MKGESRQRKRMYKDCRKEEEEEGRSSVLFVMHDKLTQGAEEGNCSIQHTTDSVTEEGRQETRRERCNAGRKLKR